MKKFLQWMHDAQIVRRSILGWAIWMTTWITIKMVELSVAPFTMEMAAVIAAIMTPVLGLTGFIIKFYAQHPYQDKAHTSEED